MHCMHLMMRFVKLHSLVLTWKDMSSVCDARCHSTAVPIQKCKLTLTFIHCIICGHFSMAHLYMGSFGQFEKPVCLSQMSFGLVGGSWSIQRKPRLTHRSCELQTNGDQVTALVLCSCVVAGAPHKYIYPLWKYLTLLIFIVF